MKGFAPTYVERALGVVGVNGALAGAAGDQRAPVGLHAHIADAACVRFDHLVYFGGSKFPV